jgi:hypothetical protein
MDFQVQGYQALERERERELVLGPRGKSFYSTGFRELMDTRLGKEEFAAADHMLLIGHRWCVRSKFTRKVRRRPLNFVE